MNARKVKRFEIYLYDFGIMPGSIQQGKRPVLIVQDDQFNKNSPTTIVAAFTSAVKKEYLPSHIFVGERFGLTKPSMVLSKWHLQWFSSISSTYSGLSI